MSGQQSGPSWWVQVDRANFSATCRNTVGELVEMKTADGVVVVQQRSAVLATLTALRLAKANSAIRQAEFLSRN